MKQEVIEKNILQHIVWGKPAAQGVGQLMLPESGLENNTPQKYVYEGKAAFNPHFVFILLWVSFYIWNACG